MKLNDVQHATHYLYASSCFLLFNIEGVKCYLLKLDVMSSGFKFG